MIAAGQAAIPAGGVAALAAQAPQLRAARTALQNAITNTHLLLDMLDAVGL